MAKRRRRKVEAKLRRGGTRTHPFKASRYLALLVVPLALLSLLGLTASPSGPTNSDYRIGDYADFMVAGDLLTDKAASLNILYPASVPEGLILAGVVRSDAFEDTVYLVYDRTQLISGEFHLLDVMRKGGVILLEEPSTRTVEEQEAWVEYVIEETEGKVERVNVNGHVGSLGHGEIPQLRWWQNGLRLILFGFLLDDEFLAIAQSVQPAA